MTLVGGAEPERRGSTARPVPGILPAALVGGLALSSGVALTTTSGWLIVAASHRPQILTLLAAIVLVRAFGIARPALRYAERVRSHDAALSFLAQERARTFARLIPLTPARLGRRSRGDVLAGVVDDLDDVAYAQVRFVVPLVAVLVAGLLAALADALILVPAGLVTLSALAWTLAVGLVDHRLEASAQRRVVAARAEVSQVSTLLATNGPELAAIGAGPDALSWLDAAQHRLASAMRRQAWGRAVGMAAMPLVIAGHTVGMVAAVVPWVQAGLSTPLAAFLVLTPVALGEVTAGIPDAGGALARAREARRRLTELLALPAAVHDPPPAATHRTGPPGPPASPREEPGRRPHPPTLELDRVSARWVEQQPALPSVSATFAPGRHVAVVGPNGSGKSTLLAVLARHLDPTAGRYLLDDRDTAHLSLAQTRAQLASLDDEPHVFASTLRENMRLAKPEATDAAIVAALRTAGLSPWYGDLPAGLDTPLGATGRGVSGGERTRLGLARALLSERPVLLLDEPDAHLDRTTARAVLADVRRASTGRTVVLVSHREEGTTGADEVLTLPGPADDAAADLSACPRRPEWG